MAEQCGQDGGGASDRGILKRYEITPYRPLPQHDYDAAVVVTNDPDQREPIHAVRKHLGKSVIVLFPIRPGRFGNTDLKKVADRTEVVDPALLASCQLPPIVTTVKGRQIRKPATW